MNRFLKFLVPCLIISAAFVSCKKEPLTLDEKTSMKAMLSASNEQITELAKKEVSRQTRLPEENIEVESLLSKINQNSNSSIKSFTGDF